MQGRAIILGNSDGIGLAITRQLLDQGWAVDGLSRSASPLDAANYTHVIADVRGGDFADILDGIVAKQPPDLCIYCVGIGEPFDPEDLGEAERTLDANLLGAARCLRVVLASYLARGGGTFVGLSSIGDAFPSAEAPSYAASKIGMTYLLEGMARATRSSGVRLVNVRLGFVDTKMAKSPVKPFLLSAERAAERILERVLVAAPPARVTIPRRMGVVVWILGLLQRAYWRVINR